MPITTMTTLVGVAKQTARGTLAAQPAFAHGLTGGTPVKVDVTQSPIEVSTAKRSAYNLVRESVRVSSEPQSPAYIKSVGLWLLGAMGSVTNTGTTNYTHTFATGDLPYLSVFRGGVGQELQAARDCKVDELTLKWDGSKPVDLSVKLAGTGFSYPATFTPTTDETGSEAYLTPVGGAFQIDQVGSTLATATITGGEISIKNNLEDVSAADVLAAVDQWEGRQEITGKLTIVVDDLVPFRKALTGAAAGTTIATTVPIGSLSLAFKENAGTGGLTVTASKVGFLTDLPDVSPKGGAVKLELAWQAVIASGGTAPVTFVLANQQATY